MKQRLSWQHIGEFFAGQWVELTEVEWRWNAPTPSLACVRHHSPKRKTLLEQVRHAPTAKGSVILFIWPVQSLKTVEDAVAF